jgi:hypothetical protein
MSARRKLSWAHSWPLGLLSLLPIGASPARADIIPVTPIKDTTLDYSFVATWGFDEANDETGVVGRQPARPWLVFLDSPASNVAGTKELTLTYLHDKVPPGAPNPAGPNTVDVGSFTQPATGVVRRGVTERFTHGNAFDIIRVLGNVRPDGASTITTSGTHTRNMSFRGSILGIDGNARFKDAAGNVLAAQVDGRPAPDPNNISLKPRNHATTAPTAPGNNKITVVAGVNGAGLPADPISITTMGFVGATDGVPGLLDLGSTAALFEGGSDFFMPDLVDPSGQTLYVAIDLAQWLNDPQPFATGDTFSFSSGISDSLPGVEVGFSPFSTDPTTGAFVTASPASGVFMDEGKLDGQAVVPEPASLSLLAGEFAVLLGVRRRARRPR